jgi:hypothetical protein
MSGFEIAGVIIAGPAIVERLLQVSLDGYRVFQNAKMVGKEIQQCGYELDITRVRLEDWMRALTKCGGDLSVVLGGKSRRYQLVLETLALIAGVFAQVEQLEKKYGIARVNLDQSRVKKLQPGEKGLGIGGWVKKYFHPPRQISSSGRSRSSSPAPKHSQSHNSSAWLPPTNLSSILDDENAILKYSRDLDLEFDARRLGECIAQMEEVAREYQQTLSTFRKYEWLFSSREELQLLIEDLKRYITSLETLTSVSFKSEMSHPSGSCIASSDQ